MMEPQNITYISFEEQADMVFRQSTALPDSVSQGLALQYSTGKHVQWVQLRPRHGYMSVNCIEFRIADVDVLLNEGRRLGSPGSAHQEPSQWSNKCMPNQHACRSLGM